MVPNPDYALPAHHLRARQVERNTNTIYKVKMDYNFAAIQTQEPVNMRMDFLNMLTYWADFDASGNILSAQKGQR